MNAPPQMEHVNGRVEVVLRDRKGAERARAIIDQADAERVGARRWFYMANGYAACHVPGSGHNGKQEYLHRYILGNTGGPEVDHINGDKLDNRRENLRPVLHRENGQNINTWASSGVRNVHKMRRGLFCVQVCVNGTRHRRFGFCTVDEAAEAARRLRAEVMTHHVEGRCDVR